ncbi:hypothetical protein FAGAP_9287 [Fusarium agapanthi]|uniref:Uncharacterized protein n=1 Tax=Fusarium agapanthi TaxID=1803897 RepID=A0A9P5B426_9HYPO|nr:hypothetical protein FAGAP_9287 [Fusarium agapanthi]
MCHSNTLYAKLPTATETLQPSQTPERLERRAVPYEMITCGYKNGDPAAMTTAESGSVCRFSTQNGIWGMCKRAEDSKCTLAGRCRDQHECAGGRGKTDNPKFRMTSCKVEYCSLAYLIMDQGHRYTYIACGAVAAKDTYYITPKAPALTTAVSQTTSTSETSKASSDTTAVTEISTTSSGSATEAPSEVSDDNRSESRSDTGAIVSGVVGGLAVLCGTAVAVIYLLRKSRAQKLEATPETRQGIEAPGQAETDNRPNELVGSKPSDVPANRQTAEQQGTLAPRRPDPVELSQDGVNRRVPKGQ